MRISYTYQNYPNCPRATEYSRSAESASAYGGMLIGPLTIGAVIAVLVCTFSFFENYNWSDFLGAIVFSIVVAIIDFYFFVIRPNNTRCEIKIILTEESSRNYPPEVVKQFCENLRKENKKENKKAFSHFFRVFIASLFATISLIAAIKGVYFLCHKNGGLFLFLGAVVSLCVFSFSIWRLVNKQSSASNSKVPQKTDEMVKVDSKQSKTDDIAFCRKCGAKILSDSVFCEKCGTKVR